MEEEGKGLIASLGGWRDEVVKEKIFKIGGGGVFLKNKKKKKGVGSDIF